jgi:hypothetical protein
VQVSSADLLLGIDAFKRYLATSRALWGLSTMIALRNVTT